jgi:F-type H+-transporting ATPase subunit epsilon
VEGEIGILPGHEPVLGVLVPSAVVIFDEGGGREVVAVDGGFISVSQGRVSILSEYARMADEITVAQAEKELAEAQRVLDTGDGDDEDRKHFLRATAQLRAAQKAQ